jgi:predicted acylesterase/phospholipase RssA
MQRALVLAGGGAKGAYAFGCLRAFRRCGIHFDAVAGTSVGALNALIWSANAFKEGRRLWSNLSFKSVYPRRNQWWRRMPKLLAWVGGFIHVAWRLVAAGARGTPHEVSKGTNLLIAAAVGIAAYFGMLTFWNWIRCSIALLVILDVYLALNEPNQAKRTRRITFSVVSLTGYCSASLALRALGQDFSAWSAANYKWVGLAIFLALFSPDRFRRSTRTVVNLAVFWSVAFDLCTSGQSHSPGSATEKVWVFLALFLGLLGIGLGISYVTAHRFNRTFLDNTPLATSIKTILSTRTLRTRVYATCALEWHAWDPDKPTYGAVVVGIDGAPLPGSPFFGDRRRMWLPLYWPVHELPMEEQVKTLLASAALPFGVVPGIEWNGWRLVDGGVADNVPLYPVANADEVFVVLLAPIRNRTMAELGLTPERWTTIDRLRRIFLYPRPPFDMPERPRPKATKVIPDRAPEKFPDIRVFAPKRSLGGFLTGTLNFNGKYARKRMREGYLDTMKSLRDMGIASPNMYSGPT